MTQRSKIISVIIATFARPQQLERCLVALSRLHFDPSQWEVIVVDDGSPGAIDSIIEQFSKQLNLRLLKQTNAGPAAARNNGAARANGEYLAFTDDDCLPEPSWLCSLVARLESAPNSLVGGRIINSLNNDIYATTSQLLIDYLYEYYHAGKRSGAFLSSNNLACSADAFGSIGGFDSRFPQAAAEDRDFSTRWAESGKPLLYAPDSIVYHAHALNIKRFIRQHFTYGRGAFHYHKLKATRIGQDLRVEPFKFYFNLLSYPFRQADLDKRFQIAVLLGISQIANALGFLSQVFLQKAEMTSVRTNGQTTCKPLL
jgi:GT2 family glycosyltransferase